jgi:hypothetical protein
MFLISNELASLFMKLGGYNRVWQSERWRMIDVYMKEVEDVWLGIAYVG